MKRREFITLIGGAAVGWPLGADAQPQIPLIGFLGGQTPELFTSRLRALRQGLAEAGYVEGSNVAIEYRWAKGQDDRLAELAADLVRRPVVVIVTSSTSSVVAARAATKSIPIVFSVSSDPVQLGLVDSLSKPSGNMTGSTSLGVEVESKRIELLRELLPSAKVIALLVHPANPGVERQISDHEGAARTLGLQLHVLRVGAESDIEGAFKKSAQFGAEALVIGPDNFLNARSQQLAALALQYRVPAIFNDRPFAAAGGLISYGASITDQYRIAGTYAGRILKGEKPADLPVQQSTKVELVINLKSAKALGLNVPPTLLARADEVIE
jgi:putative tryptophan/tyrosine transport system substrate-binding protein